jgi:hypothetical protein
MNRYDILLEKGPLLLPECNKRFILGGKGSGKITMLLGKEFILSPECNKGIILGGKGSGKTTILLNLLRDLIDRKECKPIFSIAKRDRLHFIREELGPDYFNLCRVITRLDIRGIAEGRYLFLDDVDNYLYKLVKIPIDQCVVATCDATSFGVYFRIGQLPRYRIINIGASRWYVQELMNEPI